MDWSYCTLRYGQDSITSGRQQTLLTKDEGDQEELEIALDSEAWSTEQEQATCIGKDQLHTNVLTHQACVHTNKVNREALRNELLLGGHSV